MHLGTSVQPPQRDVMRSANGTASPTPAIHNPLICMPTAQAFGKLRHARIRQHGYLAMSDYRALFDVTGSAA